MARPAWAPQRRHYRTVNKGPRRSLAGLEYQRLGTVFSQFFNPQHQLMKPIRVALICIVLAALSGCRRPEESRPNELPLVYTTFYPTTYFAERVAGPHAQVVCPLPGEADPIFWMPDADSIAAYQQADLIVTGGAELEKWMQRVSLPESKLVDTAAPFRDRWIKYTGVVTHSHGTAGQHSHEGIDPHTWLDPYNAKIQAAEIRDALIKLVPKHAEAFKSNYTSLAADLDQLDAELKEISDKLQGQTLLASHPAYNYLAQRYGWKIVNLHLDAKRLPDEQARTDLRQKVNDTGANVLLWEAPPRTEIDEFLATELGLTSVVFSPCETPAGDDSAGDYLQRMHKNIDRLKNAMID